jgi:replicative DNA helicase
MARDLSKVLPIRHIEEPAKEIIEYIDNRRKGIVRSLKTRWKKFNNTCNGGIEPNAIYSVCGISGSGKSSFLNMLETDLFDLNPREKFIILSFSLEMLSSKQIGRKLSYKLKKTTTELYSGLSDSYLSDEDFELAKKEVEIIKKYDIYYVDVPGTVDEVFNTIIDFSNKYAKNKWLIITFDHTLLIKGNMTDKERETIFNLQRVFMEIKKYNRNTIIQLSQMNREIESTERINNIMLQYPMRKDVFGSDSVFQASDYLMVLHRPELLQITVYGPSRLPTKDMIYLHFLKVREGEPKILSFINNLKYNSIEEYNPFKDGELFNQT